MTQNEKELLLKDLIARVHYGVKVKTTLNGWNNAAYIVLGCVNNVILLDCPVYDEGDNEWPVEDIRPYLFPLSSMTNEQRNELKKYTCPDGTGYFKEDHLCCPINHVGEQIPFIFMSKIIEWLDINHFDYRGLIPMGLAIDATNLNIY